MINSSHDFYDWVKSLNIEVFGGAAICCIGTVISLYGVALIIKVCGSYIPYSRISDILDFNYAKVKDLFSKNHRYQK